MLHKNYAKWHYKRNGLRWECLFAMYGKNTHSFIRGFHHRPRPEYEDCDNNLIGLVFNSPNPIGCTELADQLDGIHSIKMVRERLLFMERAGAIRLTERVKTKGRDKLYVIA